MGGGGRGTNRWGKNAGVEGENENKVERKEAEVEEEVEVEVVATVVRGSRNRAGGGPALTDYGLASRRQAAWWGGPRSSSPLSLSSPRLVLVLGLVPSLARASLFSSALLCSPLARAHSFYILHRFFFNCTLAIASTLPTCIHTFRKRGEAVPENGGTERTTDATLRKEYWR